MDIETFEQRENSKAFTLSDDLNTRRAQAEKLCAPFEFILLMGLSGTGKTSFLDACRPKPNWSMTKWQRDRIVDMFFTDERRVEKYYNYVDSFEADILPELHSRENHQVIVEGWNRMPGKRRRYLNYLPKGAGRSAVFVFDGPTDRIIRRNEVSGRLNLGKEELPIFLKDKHTSTVWPTFDEGWSHIIYINTFGGRGEEYMREHLL